VDQFRFPYDIWSRIVPATVKKMREAVKKLAVRFWWETGVDMATDVVVRTDDQCSDLMLDPSPQPIFFVINYVISLL